MIDNSVLELLGNFPRWQPGDGPAPWVFANRPAGHRCAWSCNWISYNPKGSAPLTVTASDWYPDPGRMSPEQVGAELEDMLFSGLLESQTFHGTGMDGLLTVSLAIHVTLPYNVTELTRKLIADFRISFDKNRTYVNEFNPPQNVVHRVRRPGWNKE